MVYALGTEINLDTWGSSGRAMVLGKLPVPGRPTSLDYTGAGAY